MNAPLLRWVTAVTLAVVLALGVLAPAAVAQPAAPTQQDVFGLLGVDQVPADYVVLIDISGSMSTDGRYDKVRGTLGSFLGGTTSLDHVAVYTFDDSVSLRYSGPGGQPDAVLAQLPSGPGSGGTDIGGAIAGALGELERSNAALVGTVVLLTDGENAPPAGAQYPTDYDTTAWPGLTDRVKKLTGAGHSIQGYALPLGTVKTGAELLGRVIPGALVVAPGVQDIGGFLDRAKHGVRVEKAKRILAADLGKGVVVEWPPATELDAQNGYATATVTLRSQLAKAPVTVMDPTVNMADAPGVTATLLSPPPSPIELMPGQGVPVVVGLSWSPDAGPLPYERRADVKPEVTIGGTVTSPWTQALQPDITLGVPPAPADNTRTLRLSAAVGYPWLLPVLAAVVLLLVVALAMGLYTRRHPRLAGTLELARLRTDDHGSVRLRRSPTEFAFASAAGPSGRGTVRPIRSGGRAALEITYSPDGTPARQTTSVLEPTGGALTVSGVEFTYADATDV
jgi:von Willebrand factor type A domain